MASRARQSLLIFTHNDGQARPTLALVARTGYVNININNQKFYYNDKQTYNNLSSVNIPNIMKMQENKGRRGIIVISRKR